MSETTTSKGIQLPCPRCGEKDANVALYMAEGDLFQCQECEEEFSVEDIRQILAFWGPVVKWLDAMPTRAV